MQHLLTTSSFLTITSLLWYAEGHEESLIKNDGNKWKGLKSCQHYIPTSRTFACSNKMKGSIKGVVTEGRCSSQSHLNFVIEF